MMSALAREILIRTYDDTRAAFLASLDQVIAELRPRIMASSDVRTESIVACAQAFCSRELVRSQLEDIAPGLMDEISDQDLADAHLVTVSYLFALVIHEMMRNQQHPPTPMAGEDPDHA